MACRKPVAQTYGAEVIVLAANNSNLLFGYLAGKYEGQVGVMCSPQSHWRKPLWFLPYAIDNGVYAITQAGKKWSDREFLSMCGKAKESGQDPLFVVAPDVLYDRDETLRLFDQYAPRLEKMGLPLAMACQDGMTPADVPEGVVAFMGGTDSLKQKTMEFCSSGLRVHVGRANSFRRLMSSHKCGAFSVDGSTWFKMGAEMNPVHRKTPYIEPLLRYLEWSQHETDNQGELFPCH